MRPDKRAVRSEERRRGEKKKKKRRKESKSRMAPCVRLLSFAVMSLAVYSYGAQEDVSRVSDSRKDALHWMRNRTGTQLHGKRRSGPLGVFTTRTKPEPKKKQKQKRNTRTTTKAEEEDDTGGRPKKQWNGRRENPVKLYRREAMRSFISWSWFLVKCAVRVGPIGLSETSVRQSDRIRRDLSCDWTRQGAFVPIGAAVKLLSTLPMLSLSLRPLLPY